MSKINYSNLSKEEVYLISRSEYDNQKVITSEFVKRLFGSPKKAANILDILTRKGRLIQLRRGKYLLVPIKAPNQRWTPNEFVAAALWIGDIPYYIGYFTAYNYWGFTEQMPQTVFVLNTRKNDKKLIGNIQYEALKIDENKYFGVKRIKIEGQEVLISDKERTLVDFVYNPIGSFDNISAVLKENINKIDLGKFIRYLIKFPVVSVRKRAGYLIEKIGCRDPLLIKLKKSIGNKNTYIVLNPANKTRKGKIDKEWKIIVNR
ncbi:MAG: hypothetical protein BWY26_01219 [Elusimicrobia bacterium ADurb.Bin231]|nr:MAG: hypothetical protein BWY26_01219 [Elusimicrobia bacterium ADurb.Bin231]